MIELNEEIVGKFINVLEGKVNVCEYYEITKVSPKLVYTKDKNGNEVKFKKTELTDKLETKVFIIDNVKCNPFYKLIKKNANK